MGLFPLVQLLAKVGKAYFSSSFTTLHLLLDFLLCSYFNLKGYLWCSFSGLERNLPCYQLFHFPSYSWGFTQLGEWLTVEKYLTYRVAIINVQEEYSFSICISHIVIGSKRGTLNNKLFGKHTFFLFGCPPLRSSVSHS